MLLVFTKGFGINRDVIGVYKSKDVYEALRMSLTMVHSGIKRTGPG